MPYACHKCGSMIEEGTAFCPHCGAPQIRVVMPEATPANDSPVFAPETPAETQPPAEPVRISVPPSQPGRKFSLRAALPSALVAGGVIGVGILVPLRSVAWIVLIIGAGGALSVAIFKRRHPEAFDMRPVEGGKLGALASLFGYALFAFYTLTVFMLDGPAVRQEMMKTLHEMRAPDPSAQQVYQQLTDKLSTPEGMAIMMTVSMALLFFIFLTLGAIGGAIGATLSHRDQSPRQ